MIMAKEGKEKGLQAVLYAGLSPKYAEALKEMHKIFFEHCNKLFEKRDKMLESWLKEIIPKTCVPPIKGEVTKGKLRWRGIRMTTNYKGDTYFTQRGKIISPILLNPISEDYNK